MCGNYIFINIDDCAFAAPAEFVYKRGICVSGPFHHRLNRPRCDNTKKTTVEIVLIT